MYRYLVLVILILLFENTMASCPAYDRRDYPHWIDLDQDCQNTRHEVLVEESTVPVQFKTNKNVELSPASGGIRLQGRSSTILENWTSTTWFLLRKPTNPEPMHGIKQNEKPLRMNSKIRSI